MKIAAFFCSIFLLLASDCLAQTKIAFYSTSLSYRGTDVALYDYAHFNEEILGNVSFIFNSSDAHPVVDKYRNRFKERCYFGYTLEQLEEVIKAENIDIVYIMKYGVSDGILFKNAKNAVHAVFDLSQPHGDVFSPISEWLNDRFAKNFPVVPHMIYLPNIKEDLRKELNIPPEARVFGRYGGLETFNLEFVHKAIIKTLQKDDQIWFLFMNTCPFFSHERIIYLPPTTDLEYKVKFINTCNAMIHARADGETFGLACGEFSIKNKPVLTCRSGDLAHVNILGNKGIYYPLGNSEKLSRIFRTFKVSQDINYDAYSEIYNPKAIMKRFDQVFIQPLLKESQIMRRSPELVLE